MQVKFVETYSSRLWGAGVVDTKGPVIPATVGKKALWVAVMLCVFPSARSEERRVGKECRSRWSPYH